LRVEDDLAARALCPEAPGRHEDGDRSRATHIDRGAQRVRRRPHAVCADAPSRRRRCADARHDLDPLYATAWALRGKNQGRLSTITVISSGAVSDHRREALEFNTTSARLPTTTTLLVVLS
jgi:hypothetical protein